MRNHTIVVGYGTKGRTAVAAMVGDEIAPADIVVVDTDQAALERAKSAGLVTVRGRRNQLRGAAAGRRAARQGDHRRHQPRRRRRPRHAHRARAGAQRQDHRRGPGSREPAPAAAVRRRLGGGVLRDRGPAARHRRTDAERRRDDGRPADAGCRIRDRGARGRDQGGRRVAAAPPRHRARRGARRRVDARRRPGGRRARAGDRLLYIRSAEAER